MIPLTLAEIARLTGADLTGEDLDPEQVVDGPVDTDARRLGPGGLYVARVGEHADGHDFVSQAVERGAVAALVSRPVDGLAGLVVPDPQAAFERLARAVVDRLPATVVAITGSSGKTSTKDLLAQLLSRLGPTVASAESFNGEVGVPLTVLRATTETRYLVVEMGARGVGHIAHLTSIAPPDVSVVLNVGSAHLGEFGSVDAIARAKSEIVRGLPSESTAVLNADDPAVRGMTSVTEARVVLVGQAADADLQVRELTLDEQARPSFTLCLRADSALAPGADERSCAVRLPLHGEHHAQNAAQAAAVALRLGMSLADVADALAEVEPVNRWRMQVTERADGVTVVNDAYNANPDSMRAALKALAVMGRGRRTWAVLGEMLELGSDSVKEHDLVGRLAVRLNVSRLVAVGEGARPIHTGAVHEGSWGDESVHVPDADAAHALLAEELRAGDVVLLKSSRDAGLRHLGDRLVADVAAADDVDGPRAAAGLGSTDKGQPA